MKIFLDTSALIAYYNVDDRHHSEASKTMESIKRCEIPLTRFYTTDYVSCPRLKRIWKISP